MRGRTPLVEGTETALRKETRPALWRTTLSAGGFIREASQGKAGKMARVSSRARNSLK